MLDLGNGGSEQFFELRRDGIKQIEQGDEYFGVFCGGVGVEMSVSALVEEKTLGMGCDVEILLIRRLEVQIIVITHEFSVVWDWIEP